jgi:hypothetical protein
MAVAVTMTSIGTGEKMMTFGKGPQADDDNRSHNDQRYWTRDRFDWG